MIKVEKKIGRATWRAASRTSASVERLVRASPRAAAGSPPTITMAPSTMMPKSMAPSDSRLAGILVMVHQDERDHHRERNRDADDQRAARAAEEQDEHDEDEADALENRVRDLVDGGIDQVGAIEIGHDLHVVGLEPRR